MELKQRLRANNEYLQSLIALLEQECRVDPEWIEKFKSEFALEEKEAIVLWIASMLNLDWQKDRDVIERYLRGAVFCQDSLVHDRYLSDLSFPERSGRWTFIKEKYEAYELFFADDLKCLPDGTEIPLLGYFRQPFVYPSVYENGLLWMTVTPSEMNSMRPLIQKAAGKTLVLGLGLGYALYHLSLKEEVSAITVIERDEELIDLFKANLLVQFQSKEKITLIKQDAFEAVRQIGGQFDTIFVDLWHNAADGLAMYLAMKQLESVCPQAQFLYWLENSIRSCLRWKQVFG